MAVKYYRDLIVWQKAMSLVELVYKFTAPFPREELYGLTSQMRRAAVSIHSNIAEGQGRNTTRDFLHFTGDCPNFRGAKDVAVLKRFTAAKMGLSPLRRRKGTGPCFRPSV